MTREEILNIQIETINELLEAYKTTAENTFGRKIKRNGLIFQVAKELKHKYETAESEDKE